MKRAIYKGVKEIELQEVEMPKIDDDGILVKNIIASICGSDVSTYYHGGEFARVHSGDEFGHEMISEVVKVGKNVKNVKVKDRVYPFPLMAKANPSRAGTVGGYSEYIEIPKCQVGLSVFPISHNISDIEGSLIEPLTVGCHAAKLTNPDTTKNAVVFGAGMIGMASAMALKYLGIQDIIISDISEYRLNIAKKLGFKVCQVNKSDLIEYAKEQFGDFRGKANIDIFIDAAGVHSNLDIFMNEGKFGSTLCIAAVYHQPVNIDFMKLTYGQLHIVGSPAYDISDVQTVIEMLEAHCFDIESLVTQRYPLDEIDQAIEKASSIHESLKVVIDYR